MSLSRSRASVSVLVFLSCVGVSQAALTFNFGAGTGNAQADAGFAAAGARWSALFTDSVTINIQIGFGGLPGGVLAAANSSEADYTYTNVRSSLIIDSTSADDALAVAHLPNVSAGSAFNVMINRTTDNPNGSASATPFLDTAGANTTTIHMSHANAKALGLRSANDATQDAQITFGDTFTWDFDPSDGITAGAYDFVGIATHEIGHSLGFISGVDILDGNAPPVNGPFHSDAFTYVSTLDLYRRSTLSLANGGDNTLDWVASNSGAAPYFSLDGGTTNLALFSTGINFGDGRQASHWKDSLGIGVMDPTAATGEQLLISALDIRGFDAIGWNLASATVPEPSPLALVVLGISALGIIRRRRA